MTVVYLLLATATVAALLWPPKPDPDLETLRRTVARTRAAERALARIHRGGRR